jgi:putative flippase GtrA
MRLAFLTSNLFFRYLLVGASAYLLYAGGIYLIIYGIDVPWITSLLIALLFALITAITYIFQLLFTFSNKTSRGMSHSLPRYICLALVGTIVTGVFAKFLSAYPDNNRVSGQLAISLAWNFVTYMISKKLIF